MLISQQFNTVASQNLARAAHCYLGKEVTYGDLRTLIARLSYLYQHEIGATKRVAFFARNCPAYLPTIIALSNIRCVSIPMNPDAPPEEIGTWLKESKATHVFVTSDLTSQAREILSAERLNLPIVEFEKKQGGEYDTSFSPQPENKPLENDIILLLRSGGVTGKPKFATFCHKQLNHVATSLRSCYHISGVDRVLTQLSWSMPFSFVHGMMLPYMIGATCVIEHGLQDAEFNQFVGKSRVTRLIGTPAMFEKIHTVLSTVGGALPGLKSITVGLGSLSAEAMKTFADRQIKVLQAYGQVENLWTISMQDTEMTDQPMRGLVGVKYKVIDANGDEILGKDKRVGPFCVTSPSVMTGYYGLEKETKGVLRGTWLYTHDMAELVGDGEELRIKLLGRKEDVWMEEDKVRSLGKVDAVLRTIPGAQDAAAFILKNSKGDFVLVCAVVKIDKHPINEKSVVDTCAAKLQGNYIPKAVAFTDHIPRDAGSNVNYHRLRLQLSGIAG